MYADYEEKLIPLGGERGEPRLNDDVITRGG